MSETAGNLRRSSDCAFRSVGDDGGLVVRPARSEIKVLNAVASRIYELLDGTRTRAQILSTIVAEYEIDEQQAEQDLDDYLAELERESLLDHGPTVAAEKA